MPIQSPGYLKWDGTKYVLVPESDVGGSGGTPVTFANDLTGTNTAQTVVGLQGRSVVNTAPTNGQVLTWNSTTSKWSPADPSGSGFMAGGDLTGTSSSQTISKIQNVTLDTSAKVTGSFLRYSGTEWIAAPAVVQFNGDVGGDSDASIVYKIRGVNVSGTTPTTNQVLSYNGTQWAPTTISSGFTAGGDLTGSSSNQTLDKIQTVPLDTSMKTIGAFLRYSGTQWVAVNTDTIDMEGDVGGKVNASQVNKIRGVAVSGIAPTTNQVLQYSGSQWAPATLAATADATTSTKGIVQLAGDIAGSATSVSVTKINGATVPIAGSLTTGNGLYVSGSSALTYGALNLAGGSNYVTGTLPSGNMFQATTGTSGAVRLTGDLGGTAASPTVIDLTITSETNGSMIYFNGTNWVNRSPGTANYILTANGAGAPTWNNAIQAMTNVQSQQFRLDPASGSAGYTQTFFDTLSTTSNTIATARTIAVPEGFALVVTATATAVDGYTGYAGTQRTFCSTKAGRYYRATGGSLKLSDFTSVQDLTPNFGTSDDLLLTLSISSNNLLIQVTGQSGLNAKWQVDTTIRWVAI